MLDSSPNVSAIVFIPLTRGKVAVVDFEDFELVRGRWYASAKRPSGPAYARRTIPHPTNPGKQSCVQMHTLIMGCLFVDHRNGNGLDNRRSNLRPASPSNNLRSFQQKRLTASSKFRGVCWHVSEKKWVAYIGKSNRHLGRFDSEEKAARAYDGAAKRLGFSEEALNFPPERPADFKIL